MYKFLLLSLTVIGCHNNQIAPDFKFSTEPLDTVKVVPAAAYPKPAIFEKAFIKGTTEKIDKNDISLYGVTIGKLKIPTGRIVACDPFLTEEYGIPFTQEFPKGEFPVQLSIASIDGAESVAFARIHFSEEPVQRWEFALLKGQAPVPVGGDKSYGFVIDSGIGSFMDEAASKAINSTDTILSERVLYKEMEKQQRKGWRYSLFNFGAHNLASFTAAFGDGRYSTYVGFDAGGKPCRLLTDFGFNWNKD